MLMGVSSSSPQSQYHFSFTPAHEVQLRLLRRTTEVEVELAQRQRDQPVQRHQSSVYPGIIMSISILTSFNISLSLSLSLSHNVQFLAKNVVQKRDLPEIRDAMHSEIGNRRDQDMKFPKSCGFSLTDQHMQKRNSLALGKNSETFPCI
jgi:hypothetical protein